MRIEFGETIYEARPDNAAFFIGTTLLNGLYIDLSEQYLFLPSNIAKYPTLQAQGMSEGIPVHTLYSYDPHSQPFCFIINSLCTAFRYELDELTIS